VKFWNALAFVETHEAIELAITTEDAGYDGITVPEHLFYPKSFDSKYPYSADGKPSFTEDTPWPDPWVLIGAMAARTKAIEFTTNIYVAPLRDLFTVAKAVSTAAVLAGGRLTLGLGAGWMREEFEQTGQDFDTRGKRLDEMIPALRALWTGDWAEFHGTYYDFGPAKMAPVPSEPIPIWIGGHSKAAFRRAAELCDGWMGVYYKPDEAIELVGRLKERLAQAGRADEPFDMVMAVLAPLDRDLVRRLEDAGVTGLLSAPAMFVREHTTTARLDAIKRFADDVITKVR
jgi:probable F420-dependent oxidoreductase